MGEIDIHKKDFIIAIILSSAIFLISFLVNLHVGVLYGLANALIGSIFVFFVSYFIIRSYIKTKTNLKYWQLIFYIIGWVVGLFNVFFWLMIAGIYLYDIKGKLFSKRTHKGIYIFGIIAVCFIAMWLLLVLLGLSTM